MNRIFAPLLLLFVAYSCGPAEEPSLLEEIRKLETALKSSEDISERTEEAELLINKTLAYYEANPNDTIAARQLFLAGDVARGLRKYRQAVGCLEKVWRNFPQFRLAPDALFLQGFTFEVDLKDPDNAALYYREFLRSYPEHRLVPQVTQLLELVDKSPEDLIREFQQRDTAN